MIYLSWSIYQLITYVSITFTIWFLFRLFLNKTKKEVDIEDFTEEQRNFCHKAEKVAWLISAIMLFFAAFDVGDREVVHNRTSYDLQTDQIIIPEKKEVVAPNAESVYNDYSSKIKQKGENTHE